MTMYVDWQPGQRLPTVSLRSDEASVTLVARRDGVGWYDRATGFPLGVAVSDLCERAERAARGRMTHDGVIIV